MIHGFPIDFVRQTLEQTLLQQHISDPHLFGGKNQVNIFSLYEQLLKGDDIDRYVENVRDITDQQNRTSLVLNGVVLAPTNPTITNLYSCTNIPMEWVCSLRCTLANRDQALITLNNLIDELKGSKVDIAELKCVDDDGNVAYKPFVVGTIGHNEGSPMLRDGDYVGTVVSANETDDLIISLRNKGVTISEDLSWLYCEHENKLKVVNIVNEKGEDITEGLDTPVSHGTYLEVEISLNNIYRDDQIYSVEANLTILGEDESVIIALDNGRVVNSRVVNDKTAILVVFELERDIEEYVDNYVGFDLEDIIAYKKDTSYSFIVDDATHTEIIFPPEHVSFNKYKLSMSCEAIRCDEPYTLNSEEYVKISFGGSATLTDSNVLLGNDLVKVCIYKYGINLETGNVVYGLPQHYWLEPLEMPSANDPNTRINQLVSNNFKSNTHTDAIALTLQYTFLLDLSNHLLSQLFEYGRYGTTDVRSNVSESYNAMSQNLIYNVAEYWSYWGDVKIRNVKTKISGSVDIEDTESDTMTIGLTMQIQGDNN